jgi:hypothetical protein
MLEHPTPSPAPGQYSGSLQQLRDARRTLKVCAALNKIPALPIADWLELQKITAAAKVCVGAAISELVETLDLFDGDPDQEGNGDEHDYSVAGWAVGRYGSEAEDAEEDDAAEKDDHGGGNVDDEGEREEGL